MSVYSRDYMTGGGTPQQPGKPSSWTLVTWLIVINVAAFVVDLISGKMVSQYLSLSVGGIVKGWIWTPFTYQFLHKGVVHLLLNMIGLFFLGRLFSQIVGEKHLLRVYLLAGVLGAIFQWLFNLAFGITLPTVGASGSIIGILVAVATLVPHQSINLLLFFVLPIKLTLRQVAMLVVGIDLLFLIVELTGSIGSVAIMAHLGGAAMGWLYIRYFYKGVESGASRKKKKRNFGIRIIRDQPKKETASGSFVSTNVDSILDKINEKGFQSLTEEEKTILDRSSKKLSRRLDNDK